MSFLTVKNALPCWKPVTMYICVCVFNACKQNDLLSSVTQAAHLCISDQKHLQRKHCIKIPGSGLIPRAVGVPPIAQQ